MARAGATVRPTILSMASIWPREWNPHGHTWPCYRRTMDPETTSSWLVGLSEIGPGVLSLAVFFLSLGALARILWPAARYRRGVVDLGSHRPSRRRAKAFGSDETAGAAVGGSF